jgi:FixJ family two-component response regulator
MVDDDLRMRDALGSHFRSVDYRVEEFSSAPDMLQSKLPDIVSCIVLDVSRLLAIVSSTSKLTAKMDRISEGSLT